MKINDAYSTLKILAALLFVASNAKAAITECIGPKDATHYAIYLHGMDTEKPSEQEKINREHLAAVAKELKMKIALPRAPGKCPVNESELCWGWNFKDAKENKAIIATITAAKLNCFVSAKDVGLIGFANGGQAVNQIYRSCNSKNFAWFISVGAGSAWGSKEAPDLNTCGPIRLIAGKQDKYNFESIKGFAKWLTEKKADVAITEFEGGLILPEKELKDFLTTLIKK